MNAAIRLGVLISNFSMPSFIGSMYMTRSRSGFRHGHVELIDRHEVMQDPFRSVRLARPQRQVTGTATSESVPANFQRTDAAQVGRYPMAPLQTWCRPRRRLRDQEQHVGVETK